MREPRTSRSCSSGTSRRHDGLRRRSRFDEPPQGAALPGAPTGVAGSPAQGRGPDWTAPTSNGGSAISSYSDYAVHRLDRADADDHRLSATSYTVRGLTNGTAYTFKSAAINGVGTGADSAAPRQSRRRSDRAGAPTGITAVPDDSMVTVGWTPPATDGGAPITGYASPRSSGQRRRLRSRCPAGRRRSYEVTGLTNGPRTRSASPHQSVGSQQLVAAGEVAVQGRRGHAEVPGDGAQAQRRGAVGGQVAAGCVQDLRRDLRPGPLPGGARCRIGHPPMIAQKRDR